jgi:hypothetical protein
MSSGASSPDTGGDKPLATVRRRSSRSVGTNNANSDEIDDDTVTNGSSINQSHNNSGNGSSNGAIITAGNVHTINISNNNGSGSETKDKGSDKKRGATDSSTVARAVGTGAAAAAIADDGDSNGNSSGSNGSLSRRPSIVNDSIGNNNDNDDYQCYVDDKGEKRVGVIIAFTCYRPWPIEAKVNGRTPGNEDRYVLNKYALQVLREACPDVIPLVVKDKVTLRKLKTNPKCFNLVLGSGIKLADMNKVLVLLHAVTSFRVNNNGIWAHVPPTYISFFRRGYGGQEHLAKDINDFFASHGIRSAKHIRVHSPYVRVGIPHSQLYKCHEYRLNYRDYQRMLKLSAIPQVEIYHADVRPELLCGNCRGAHLTKSCTASKDPVCFACGQAGHHNTKITPCPAIVAEDVEATACIRCEGPARYQHLTNQCPKVNPYVKVPWHVHPPANSVPKLGVGRFLPPPTTFLPQVQASAYPPAGSLPPIPTHRAFGRDGDNNVGAATGLGVSYASIANNAAINDLKEQVAKLVNETKKIDKQQKENAKRTDELSAMFNTIESRVEVMIAREVASLHAKLDALLGAGAVIEKKGNNIDNDTNNDNDNDINDINDEQAVPFVEVPRNKRTGSKGTGGKKEDKKASAASAPIHTPAVATTVPVPGRTRAATAIAASRPSSSNVNSTSGQSPAKQRANGRQ